MESVRGHSLTDQQQQTSTMSDFLADMVQRMQSEEHQAEVRNQRQGGRNTAAGIVFASDRERDEAEFINALGDGEHLGAGVEPHWLATTSTNVASEVVEEMSFAQAWENLDPLESFLTCEEAVVSKEDDFDHSSNLPAHETSDENQIRASTSNLQDRATTSHDGTSVSPAGSADPDGTALTVTEDGVEFEDEILEDRGFASPDRIDTVNTNKSCAEIEQDATSASPNVVLPLLKRKRKRKAVFYPLVSKKKRKKALAGAGFQYGTQHVENQTAKNRKRSKLSKAAFERGRNDVNSEDANPILSTRQNQPACARVCICCGKQFSNVWFLAAHSMRIHNAKTSPKVFEEFLKGYTAWYCSKGENGEQTSDEREGKNARRRCTKSQRHHASNSDSGFWQVAMQGFLESCARFSLSHDVTVASGASRFGRNEKSGSDSVSLMLATLHTQFCQQQSSLGKTDARAEANGSVETGIGDSSNSLSGQRKIPTLISDDQHTILRSHFDVICALPSATQITEMAIKTALPPKAVKSWFMRTLFKERQKAKKSLYQFNACPTTSLDDAVTDVTDSSGKTIAEVVKSRRSEGANAARNADLLKLSIELENEDLESVEKIHSISEDDGTQITASNEESNDNIDPLLLFYEEPITVLPGFDREVVYEDIRRAPMARATDFSRYRYYCRHRKVSRNRKENSVAKRGRGYWVRPKRRRFISHCTRFSSQQLEVMGKFFDNNAHPSDLELEALSETLLLPTRVTASWFKRARLKAKRSDGVECLARIDGSQTPEPTSLQSQAQSPCANAQSPVDRGGKSNDDSTEGKDLQFGQSGVTFPTSDASPQDKRLPSATQPPCDDITNTSTSQCDVVSSYGVASPLFESEHRYARGFVSAAEPVKTLPSTSQATIARLSSVGRKPAGLTASRTGERQATSGCSGVYNTRRKPRRNYSFCDVRLKTSITPIQLEYLLQQYSVNSNPSRKDVEQMSDVVGLTSQVIRTWFGNTKTKERKGGIISMRQKMSHLGQPQSCPHCQVTFRDKASLDAHISSKCTSSSVAASSESQNVTSHGSSHKFKAGQLILLTTLPTSSAPSCGPSTPVISASNEVDCGEISSSLIKEAGEKLPDNSDSSSSTVVPLSSSTLSTPSTAMSTGLGSPNAPGSNGLQMQRKSIGDHSESSATSKPCKLSIDALAQSLQDKATKSMLRSPVTASASLVCDAPPSQPTSSVSGERSPSLLSSESPVRNRTRITPLQIRCLTHYLAEFEKPTLEEREMLAVWIGLSERVIQVWFQNTKSKNKRKGRFRRKTVGSATNTCSLCPDSRFDSPVYYRFHIFSKAHFHSFLNTCNGDTTEKRGRPTSVDINVLKEKQTSNE